MASTQIGTTTDQRAVVHVRSLVVAGTRLYWVGSETTDLVYLYSDDNGATWTGRTVISTDEFQVVSAVYDAVNGRLNIAYAGSNTVAKNLCLRAITSNVTSGTPGALTTETVIATAAANVGTYYPDLIHSATGTNPRYWILGEQQTGAGAYETRAWFCNAGSAADTAGNWSTTNFTNLGANSGSGGYHMGLGVWWQVGGAEKVTFVFEGSAVVDYETVTFDPTAATPTPGTVTTIASGQGNVDHFSQGLSVALNAKADYLVFGSLDADDNMWDFFKTVDGITWSNPSGWVNLTMGRGSLSRYNDNFMLLHTGSYGDTNTTESSLWWRQITTSTDTMGSPVPFSDTPGTMVTMPLVSGTTVVGVYRGSTASPYTVRSDIFPIASVAWTVA